MQTSRRHFIPSTPACYENISQTKIRLVRSTLPIKQELKPIFPTLLQDGEEGMPNIEVVVDNEYGAPIQSQVPLRVSNPH